MFTIKKDSPVPIYYQIEEGIKESIQQGSLKPGHLMPSEREFSERFEVSRMTVRQAITNLVNGGYLVRQRGKGTFVASSKFDRSLQGLTSFSEDMRARGMTPSSQLVSFSTMKASQKVADRLMIDVDEEVYEIKRVRLADGIPMAYEVLYMAKSLAPKLEKDKLLSSLYDYAQQDLQLHIAKGKQVIEATNATKEEADLLEINEGDSLLLIERQAILSNDRPFEFARSLYRADRYKFSIEINR